METKVLELRDSCTMIPALCVNMNSSLPIKSKYLRSYGYANDGRPNILLTHFSSNGTSASNDPYFWRDRTYHVAHMHIIDNWDKLSDGDVVDVEFILKEKDSPSTPEIGKY